MTFEPLEAPFADVERLGCRDLFWGEHVILDLFEYLESGPAGEVEVEGQKVSDVQIGLTPSSRIWRLTFERALALKVRDESLKFFQPQTQPEPEFPSVCCFAYKSPWLSEIFPDSSQGDPRLGELVPIHYVFALLDDFIEIIADDSPIIEQVANDLS